MNIIKSNSHRMQVNFIQTKGDNKSIWWCCLENLFWLPIFPSELRVRTGVVRGGMFLRFEERKHIIPHLG